MKTMQILAFAAGLLGASAHAGPATVGALQTYSGICEPSAAVAYPQGSFDGTFIVANDESNALLAYSAAEGGTATYVPGGDLDKEFAPPPPREIDFEGATWAGGKTYWIGSHSRGNNGKLRPERWQFFSMTAGGDGMPTLQLNPARSSHDLLPAFAGVADLLKKAIKLDDDDDNDLAPDKEGFNIEALTAAKDGKSILIGLRNPLTADEEAIVVALENPSDLLGSGGPAKLGPIVPLALGGRGVRSMEYSAGAGAYFIMAGSRNAAAEPFELFRWSGEAGEQPVPVEGSAAALASLNQPTADGTIPFTPEAMIVDASGKRLLLLSDDGDSCDKDDPKFRSVVMTLS